MDEQPQARGAAAMQDPLFAADAETPEDQVGYRGPEASAVVGITYRQLDYWARTDLVVPSVRPAGGSGTQRLYSYGDLLLLRVVKRLLDAGITLQQVRVAIAHLRGRGAGDIASLTLVSDGVSVYECTQDDEVIDLLRGGQGIFAIALSGVRRDVEGGLATLSVLPAASAPASAATDEADGDELARRRRLRLAS